MKLLFNVEDQVHTFTVTEEINRQDLAVMKIGITRFLDSNPAYVVVDFSQATSMVPDLELQTTIQELRTISLSKQIHFYIAQTDIESIRAQNKVIELALANKVKTLQNKVEIREKLKADAQKLLSENENLKATVREQLEKLKALKENASTENQSLVQKLSPMLEKLWSVDEK